MSASAKRPFRIAAASHCFTAALLLTSTQALAEELLERVVVRNRLYRVAGRFEISPTIGFSLVDRLTSHINLTLGLGYHFSDSWALELRAGYAFSGHTSLADQVAADFLQKNIQLVDDLSSLWEMKGSAVLGVRWSPIYGKISLLAEVPVLRTRGHLLYAHLRDGHLGHAVTGLLLDRGLPVHHGPPR